jgi:hypothetical protein
MLAPSGDEGVECFEVGAGERMKAIGHGASGEQRTRNCAGVGGTLTRCTPDACGGLLLSGRSPVAQPVNEEC